MKTDITIPVLGDTSEKKKHYRDLYKKQLFRLLLTYLVPFILFILYFQFQHLSLLSKSSSLHMKSIAENQAKTLDLYLRERVVNLVNLMDDPKIQLPPSPEMMKSYLERLKRESNAFIDIGFFDFSGVQAEYAGPIPTLEKRNYSKEKWYLSLKENKERYIITDIYLGFRQKPHFTIGVKRTVGAEDVIMRATLDPGKIYGYMTSIEDAKDVSVSAVNRSGSYQLVPSHLGAVLDNSEFIPPLKQSLGTETVISSNGNKVSYAYAWLQTAPWAIIIEKVSNKPDFGKNMQPVIIGAVIIIVIFGIIIVNSKKLVRMEKEKDIARSQLEHAAKLASLGELAAGIAHEINNPLAIIASEVGLIKDLMDMKDELKTDFNSLLPNLENIHDAVYRCRDITGKLLSFVRKDEINLKSHNVHKLIDEVVSGFLEREMAASGIKIERTYSKINQTVVIDRNQFEQVLLNIINNAVDAIVPPGQIKIVTNSDGQNILITITDTGIGMTRDQMDKIFLPFYTTKEVGKGTGLGLSVSYMLIKNMGGKLTVDSKVGEGSSFSIILPISKR